MDSRAVRTNVRRRRRDQQLVDVNVTQNEHQQDQRRARQVSMMPQIVSGPPIIDLDDIEDDDDVVEATASDFARAKNNSTGKRRVPSIVESGGTTRLSKNRTRLRSDQASFECNECNKSRKFKAKAPEQEPKFNCPICLCPFTEETSTKCGHIFCSSCIKNALSSKAKCPTCRKNVKAKDLIRVFLPTTR